MSVTSQAASESVVSRSREGGEGTDWSTFQEKATTYGDEKPGLRACAVRAVDVEEPDEEKEWALVGTLLEIRHIASLT